MKFWVIRYTTPKDHVAEITQNVRRNRIKANTQIGMARVEANARLKRKPTPADEGNEAAKEDAKSLSIKLRL